ncbi:AraC family transcriptional activator of pobA [Chryseobacterium ginsenosidimutans]|uniref:helix-turn-helix domain-containing protein n=1 Tax=Chryseobacterium ginsenosidimutans TaxID=687846 RepID=UPI0027819C14|nr:AraC family transcriptional regulator [Chryseobacterium ginsenosidimutans]MDQ0594684.1 AraC family transcriptional activator of pobA [Chryseobacterium ginsenosidimutans]
MENAFFSVQKENSEYFSNIFSDSMYHIFLFNGNGKIVVDFVEYNFAGRTVFFSSPFQNIQILSDTLIEVEVLNFHSDFYCIEYHKKEVACNGLLFNNIYLFPHFSLTEEVYLEILNYFLKIQEVDKHEDFSGSVLQSYLQLILAISSKEKNKLLPDRELIKDDFNELKSFQRLVEEHFLSERNLSFYADLLYVTSNTLSKKIKSKFNKTPSQIIQERVILEAKKQIHLTRKSIKEIAVELNFNDEFHFSKYFKKYVGISPTQFRKEAGISIVADLYK